MTNYWKRLKSYPYLYHLVLIAGVVAGLLLAAHFAMQLGTRHGQHRTVPDFTGLALDDAGRLAQRNSLELRVNDSLFVPAYDGGVVLDQLPHEGTQVKGGRTVYVTINSFSQKKVEVPYVAGRSLRQAKNMLEIAGLEIDRLVYQPDMATNYVLEQRVDGRPIEAGTKRQIEMGSGVTLYVGVAEGDSVVVVPKVIGVSLREAKSRLWEQGFNVGAVVFDEGTIEGNIGRSPKDKLQMCVFADGEQGKHAVTHWRVVRRYGYVTLVECRLETGRTHQIRVHMAWKGFPLFNDARYGGARILKGTTFSKYRQFVENCFALLPRQALHARCLGFVHPSTGREVYFESELPADFRAVLDRWENYAAHVRTDAE